MSENNWVCSICLEVSNIDCFILEPCNHKFHTKCLIKCLRKCGPKCPYCRGEDNENFNTNVNFYISSDILQEIGYSSQDILIDEDLNRAISRSFN